MKNILFVSFLENFKGLEKIFKNQYINVTDSFDLATKWLPDYDLIIFDSRLFDNLGENILSIKEQSLLLNKIEEYGVFSFFHPIELDNLSNIIGLKTRADIALL